MNYRVLLLVFILAQLLAVNAFSQSNTKSGVRPQVISLPGGPGAIEGLGESFEPQLNTGTGKYNIPLSIPPGRAGFAPDLGLVYDSGSGNGVVGMGWHFTVKCVKRQSDKGLPGYNNAGRPPDTYINESGAELVRVQGTVTDDIQVFRLKNEGAFERYEYILKEDRWICTDSSGRRYSLGAAMDNKDISARIKNPNNSLTYGWYLGESVDVNGNQIFYDYVSDKRQVYCKNIKYSISKESPGTGHVVEFTYESRHDPIVDYRPTFRLVTALRIKQVAVKTGDKLVRSYKLEYHKDRSLSLLSKFTPVGADGKSTLPPAEFEYTKDTLSDITPLIPITGLSSASLLITGENSDINVGSAAVLDFGGDSLPDLYQSRTPFSPPDEFDVCYDNMGNGHFVRHKLSEAESLGGLKMQSNNSLLQDINGDGLADLVAQTGGNKEDFVFRLNEEGKWAAKDTPFKFSVNTTAQDVYLDPDIRTTDLNFDKKTDTIRSYYTVGPFGQGVVF